jgi:hypothetical protein
LEWLAVFELKNAVNALMQGNDYRMEVAAATLAGS